jgi:hypothetical protein
MKRTTQIASQLAITAALLSAGNALAQVACGAATTLSPVPEYSLTFQVCGNALVGSVTTTGTGWAAFGFGPDELMPDTDVFMAGVSAAGVAYSQDAFAVARSAPVRDLSQDVTLISTGGATGGTSYSFSRLLNTGDTAGDFDLTNGSYYVLMAYHATNDSLTARHTWREASELAYTFAPVPEPESILMMLAGLGLMASRLQRRR